MRIWAIILAAALAACGQNTATTGQAKETPPEDASVGSTGVGRAPDPSDALAVRIERAQILGVWSFDRSCASGDGMGVFSDGRAGFDETGEGTWSLDENGRLVLDLRISELGVEADPATLPRTTVTIEATEPVTDNLIGRISGTGFADVPAYANEPVNGRRCRPEELR